MNFSIVIPSKTTSNLVPCVNAVWKHEPGARIIVVDDGIPDSAKIMPPLDRCEFIKGISPFVFARNCNLGIRAAGNDDVILLNDDAMLTTPGGFTMLSEQAASHHEYGVISAVTNSSGNRNQMRMGSTSLREDPRMVCFIACYIPRTTINKVGLLNEEFTSYGFEDDAYCLRTRRAGLKIGIFDGCFVDHKCLTSTFRGHGHCDLKPGLEIFKRLFGCDNFGRPA